MGVKGINSLKKKLVARTPRVGESQEDGKVCQVRCALQLTLQVKIMLSNWAWWWHLTSLWCADDSSFS